MSGRRAMSATLRGHGDGGLPDCRAHPHGDRIGRDHGPLPPLLAGPDLALVHNGSFSNHASIRRRLAAEGVYCTTDNDSEVAARFLGASLAEGADLEKALCS